MSPGASAQPILAIHPGALGDVVQAVPALRALRGLGGGSHVTFAGQPRLGRLLVGTGVVGAALGFDGLGLEHLFASDAAPVELQARLARFGRVVSWFGARADGYRERLERLAADVIVAPPVPGADEAPTVWQHLLGSVGRWRVEARARTAPLDVPAAWREEARRVLVRLGVATGSPLLLVHPGAGAPAKRWPVERFARVIRTVAAGSGCQVLVHQGPADEAAARELHAELAGAPRIPVLTLHEPPLDLLAAALGEAAAYLGADSGVSQLAAACGSRGVILYSPAYRRQWAPWEPHARPLTMTTEDEDAGTATDMLAMILRFWPGGAPGGTPVANILDSPAGPS